MGSEFTIGFLSLCLVFALSFMSGCDSRTECQKHFALGSQVRACQTGADQIAPKILKDFSPRLPEAEKVQALCMTECEPIMTSTESKACSDACTAVIGLIRSREIISDTRIHSDGSQSSGQP